MSNICFMLAHTFQLNMNVPRVFKGKEEHFAPIGWLMSEKLDGYRGQWDPEDYNFWSRQKKLFNAPEWFKKAMPYEHLDGELFCGRENFQKMGAVRKKNPTDEDWFPIKFYVYDAPSIEGEFYDRYVALQEIVKQAEINWNELKTSLGEKFHNVSCPIVLTRHHEVESIEHMKSFYKEILDLGGEGIMLKNPWSEYEEGRSYHLLKWKPNYDAEGIVVDYKEGTGKYKNMLGSLVIRPLINKGNYQVIDKDENHDFSISGMDDSIRNSYKITHPIGTIITYEYSGMTEKNIPRFARYMRIRDDVIIKEEENMDVCDSDVKLKNCIKIFQALSKYERSNGEGFKAAAYNKALKTLEGFTNDSEVTSENLLKVKGIGPKIVEKALMIMNTGSCPMYDNIKDLKDPRELFMEIHGVGAVKAKQIANMGISSIEELKNHMNLKDILNDVQIKGLKWHTDMKFRIPYSEIQSHEHILKNILNEIDPYAELTISGSYRRCKETSGDIDILINTPNVKNNSIYNAFIDKLFELKYLKDEFSRGPKKFMGICSLGTIGRRIDIMYTKQNEYPFAILYFTGSMEFNVKMRSELLEKGLSLNEYGVKDTKTNKMVKHDCITEKDVFKFLGYNYVEPANR